MFKKYRIHIIQIASAFFFCSLASATNIKEHNETYKDIIQKAQSLILQKDRAQALIILETSLQREQQKKSKEFVLDELKNALFAMSRLFISDKAHGLYELGLSLLPLESTQAIQRIEDGLKIENDNLQMINQLIRINLFKKDCDNAKSLFAKHKLEKKVFYDYEVELLNAQIDFCAEKTDLIAKKNEKKDSLKKTDKARIYWLELEILRSIKERNFSRAKDFIAEIKKTDNHYTEISYLEWLLDLRSENTKNLSANAQKYLVSCRNISSIKMRGYLLNPWLCQRTVEVETNQSINAN